jgi:hypothetical protein
MKIYLAARYGRAAEMCKVRTELQKYGHEITSHWIDGLHNADQDSRYAQEDFDDVVLCDAVVSFTGDPNGRSRGGRHVEFGVGLALRKRMIIVGPRENVFHRLPVVEVYSTLLDLLNSL